MKINIEIKNKTDIFEWDTPLLQNDSSTIYQSFYWAKLYEDVYESKPFFLFVKNNGKIIGQLLLFIHSKYYWQNANLVFKKVGTKFKLGSIISWHYGPVIHDNKQMLEITKELTKQINSIAMENDIIFINGSFNPLSLTSDISFLDNGYSKKQWGTYIIELSNQKVDSFFDKLDKKTRYDIRKGISNNLKFEVSDQKDTIDEYIELKHLEREKVNLKTSRVPEYNQKYWEYLANNNHLKLFVARLKNEMIGGILGISFNRNIVQHGVLNIKKELFGGPFLTWNAIKWSIENNYKTFDMGGFNPNPESNKEKSIDYFKSRWNGKTYYYSLFNKILKSHRYSLSSALIHPERISKKLNTIFRAGFEN
jgi:lipid II:glycine glycyltransferase (peptidoglycan interpeptide bridge formation enzyme)